MNCLSPICAGWSGGYLFSRLKADEEAYRQGENPFLVTIPQIGQAIYIKATLSPFTQFSLHPLIAKIASVVTSIWVTVPLFLSASYLQNLPVKGEGSAYFFRKALHITAGCIYKYSGTFLYVAFTVAAVALIILGKPLLGAPILAALTYQVADSFGLIPQRISQFMEAYMPILSSVGSLIIGGILLRLISTITLLNYCTPIKMRIVHLCDKIIFSKTKLPSSGTELDPLVQNKKLSYEKINQIMNASDDDFVINAAYASKPCFNNSQLPHDYNFRDLKKLTNRIDWNSKYPLIKAKLRDDDQFIAFLEKKFPEHARNTKNVFDTLLERLAQEKNISVESYAAHYVQEHMKSFSKLLRCPYLSRVKGLQSDLAEARENTSMILAYLKTLDWKKDKVTGEDILLKLAVEGGDYCALGMERASREILPLIYSTRIAQISDPISQYELALQQKLELLRYQILQQKFQELTQEASAIRSNVHIHDIVFLSQALNFYPLTSAQRFAFNAAATFLRFTYRAKLPLLLNAYKSRLPESVKEIGRIHFWDYIRQALENNELLTEAQKEDLIPVSDPVKLEKNEKPLMRLMFVMLGVLCFKN